MAGSGCDMHSMQVMACRWGKLTHAHPALTRHAHPAAARHAQISDAEVQQLDCWRIRLILPDPSYNVARTYALTEVEEGTSRCAWGSALPWGEGAVLHVGGNVDCALTHCL